MAMGERTKIKPDQAGSDRIKSKKKVFANLDIIFQEQRGIIPTGGLRGTSRVEPGG
jgi:hypothetical protein